MRREDFWSNVKVGAPDECWEWQRGTNSRGYGRFCYQGKSYRAHRQAYQLSKGDIPESMQVLHRCDRPICCNPNHLFLGTGSDNMRDMTIKGRRYVPKGEQASRAKLTEQQVRDIRKMSSEGATYAAIGKLYGLHRSSITNIVTRQSWKHLSD